MAADKKRVKAGKKAKRKGGGFERQVCKILKSLWPDGDFERTPASGGSQLKVGWQLAGDIVTTSPTFPFCVECKKQEKWRLEGIHLDNSIVYKWWEQTLEEAAITKKHPMLVFSRNHVPVYAAIKVRHWNKDVKKPRFFIKTKKFFVFLIEELERLYKEKL